MNELPKRKSIRLTGYDYSQNGAYFITICADEKRHIFGEISTQEAVERGTALAVNGSKTLKTEGASPFPTIASTIKLSQYGKAAEEQLLLIENRYETIQIDKYVIMPNHIHIILFIQNGIGKKASTISDVICAYKSLTTRRCKALGYFHKHVFQTSFYDHIIRNQEDYQIKWRYIDENPLKWQEDDLYS